MCAAWRVNRPSRNPIADELPELWRLARLRHPHHLPDAGLAVQKAHRDDSRLSGVWKYRALLPSIPDDAVVTRFEGTLRSTSTIALPNTPVLRRLG
ncbi:MAG: hypothetical protein R2843_01095 [Thermomicrobiales bacterium]